MIDPYPNLRMLQIIEGERGGIPVLPPAGVDWSKSTATGSDIRGTLTPGGNIPDPATRAGQERADRLAKKGIPLQLPPGGDDPCFLPTPWGCILSRDTATLIGVNLLLLVALVAGVLLIAGKPTVAAVGKVADVAL